MRAAVLMQAILMLAVLLADTVRAEPSLVPNGRLDRNLAFATALDGGNVLQPQVVTLKSPYKAALFSALLPGTGELYAGHKGRGIAFLTAEVGIWVTYGAFKIQEDVRHDRAIEYAVNVAGANNGGTDDYYKAVGRFMRSDGPGMWNEFVRRRARDTGEVIGPEYFGADAWAWTSQANL